MNCSVQVTACRNSKEATEDEKKNGVLRRKKFSRFYSVYIYIYIYIYI